MTKPKLNDKPTSHYNDMLLALIPIMLCATVLYGGRVLLICATGFAVARAVDVWVAVMRHKEIDVSDKSSAVAAITFCMLLPVSIPL
ncbi:MAG: RnfABCDGE type electron transport complex subunit D, partial [Oscillospiraceae bacterium]